MAFEALTSKRRSLISQIGKSGLNALFPKDFEYYALSLELVNSDDLTEDFFFFPILPKQIRDTHREITTVRKSLGGVHVLKNSTFVPRAIEIRGNFGTSFKLLIDAKPVFFKGVRFTSNLDNNNIELQNPEFSNLIKTGYGCIKVIESMKERSKKLDHKGKPRLLYLWNPILGNNYQVEFSTFTHEQNDSDQNMIPNYSINLIAVAPLEAFPKFTPFSLVKNLAFANIQKRTNKLVSNITNGFIGI